MTKWFLALLTLLVLAASAQADPGNYPKLALTNVLVAEGGYSNHPADSGGRTLHGIIQRVYDADRDERGLPPRTITPALAKDPDFLDARDRIYRVRYWEPCAGPQLPRGLDFTVFSMCVNAGITRGWVMLMQMLDLKAERPYARMDDVLAAIERMGARRAIHAYGDMRRRFYINLSQPGMRNAPFRNGWLTRETRERRAAIAMASPLMTGATAIPGTPGAGPSMPKAVDDPDELMMVVP